MKSGVNVNEKENESGLAPLHYSAGAGKSLYLYSNLKNKKFEMTRKIHVIFLFFGGLEKITKLLIDGGAKVDIRNAEGKTPLEIAAVNGRFVLILIKQHYVNGNFRFCSLKVDKQFLSNTATSFFQV